MTPLYHMIDEAGQQRTVRILVWMERQQGDPAVRVAVQDVNTKDQFQDVLFTSLRPIADHRTAE